MSEEVLSRVAPSSPEKSDIHAEVGSFRTNLSSACQSRPKRVDEDKWRNCGEIFFLIDYLDVNFTLSKIKSVFFHATCAQPAA